jgi:hypothetical protein
MDWQPIETAPRDGRYVLLWHKSSGEYRQHCAPFRWTAEVQAWTNWDGETAADDDFTHWGEITQSMLREPRITPRKLTYEFPRFSEHPLKRLLLGVANMLEWDSKMGRIEHYEHFIAEMREAAKEVDRIAVPVRVHYSDEEKRWLPGRLGAKAPR